MSYINGYYRLILYWKRQELARIGASRYNARPRTGAAMHDISHLLEFLPCVTPQQWLDDAMKPENHDLAFQLFQIPTHNFAYAAGKKREQRRFMGIRKGIFCRDALCKNQSEDVS